MNILNNYITFLQEYKKLLERGVKDIFAKTVLPSFIWIDDIERLVNDKLCETTITDFFIGEYDSAKSIILSLDKPLKPKIIKEKLFTNHPDLVLGCFQYQVMGVTKYLEIYPI